MSVSRSPSYALRTVQSQPRSLSVRNMQDGPDGRRPIDWPRWLRLMERKRRLVSRPRSERAGLAGMHWQSLASSGSGAGGSGAGGSGASAFKASRPHPLPPPFLYLGTVASFRLEGLDVTEAIVLAATQRSRNVNGFGASQDRGRFRSRLAQRIRSHIAILHQIERSLGRGEMLKTEAVVRWYTLVSSGLSITSLDESTMARLDQLVRRMNSPHLRLQPAVQEIARLHAESLADPLVPGFNGILARLLLRYHLGRCGLPPVVFDADIDGPALTDEQRLLPRLLELIEQSYDLLLSGIGAAADAV